ncbi:MAG: hypothetical protein L3K07_05725 [Thermoplasmata archaeon]|nr:hypothetical protein [Thermoplasmata archaeon]
MRALLRLGPVVVVVSARAGVTDQLESLLRSPPRAVLEKSRVTPSDRPRARAPSEGRPYLGELKDLLRHAGPRARSLLHDEVLADGERAAASWFATELERAGIPAEPLHADRMGLIVDGDPANRRIDLEESREAVNVALRAAMQRGRVPVVTGYLGRSSRGAVRTLGRGSSDYSATAIASLLGARRVELVKATKGILTADPALVPRARTVPRLSYLAAEEVANAGARVLHRHAIPVARRAGIPVLVGSLPSLRPGTLISRTGSPEVLALVAHHPGTARSPARAARGSSRSRILLIGADGAL